MEYLEGETLAARIKRGPLPLHEALNIAIATASALGCRPPQGYRPSRPEAGQHHAHATAERSCWISASPNIEQASPVTEETMTRSISDDAQVVGTLLYMAPEQLQGKPADARSDIFAFGAVLYEMLSGKRAFDRNPVPTSSSQCRAKSPSRCANWCKDVPEELSHLSSVACASSPKTDTLRSQKSSGNWKSAARSPPDPSAESI